MNIKIFALWVPLYSTSQVPLLHRTNDRTLKSTVR